MFSLAALLVYHSQTNTTEQWNIARFKWWIGFQITSLLVVCSTLSKETGTHTQRLLLCCLSKCCAVSDTCHIVHNRLVYVCMYVCMHTGIMTLGIIGVYDLLFVLRFFQFASLSKRILPFIERMIGVALVGMMLLYVRHWISGGFEIDMDAHYNKLLLLNSTQRMASIPFLLSIFGMLLLFPWYLCFEYTELKLIEFPMSDYRVLYGVAFLLALACFLVFALAYLKRGSATQARILAGFGWIVITILPSSQIFFFVGFLVAERVLYLPSVGYCYLFTYIITKLFTHYAKFIGADGPSPSPSSTTVTSSTTSCSDDSTDQQTTAASKTRRPKATPSSSSGNSNKRKFARWFCAALVGFTWLMILFYYTRTQVRIPDWSSEEALFKSTLTQYPNHSQCIYGLGWNAYVRGRYEEAVKYLDQCLENVCISLCLVLAPVWFDSLRHH
jgi:hypothetical protein